MTKTMKYIKPETVVIATAPVVMSAASPDIPRITDGPTVDGGSILDPRERNITTKSQAAHSVWDDEEDDDY